MTHRDLQLAKKLASTREGTEAPIEVILALRELVDPAEVTASVAYQVGEAPGTQWLVTWTTDTQVVHANATSAATKHWDFDHSVNHPLRTVDVAAHLRGLFAITSVAVTSVSADLDEHDQEWRAKYTYMVEFNDGAVLELPPRTGRVSPSPEDEAAFVIATLREALTRR